MSKLTAAGLAASVLFMSSAAIASPAPGAISANQNGAAGAESQNIVQVLMSKAAMSVSSTVTSLLGDASGGSGDGYYSTPIKECEGDKEPVQTEPEPEEKNGKEAIGPEPIYFGF